MHISSILIFSVILVVGECAYFIVFEPDESPPDPIPTDPVNRLYSIAVNAITSVPVKATIRDDRNNVVETGDASSVMFDIESIDTTGTDTWTDSGGELCVWGIKAVLPRRLQRKYFTFICEGGNKLVDYPADRGMLVVDGLMHKHAAAVAPTNNRKYRFTAHLPDGNTISADTKAFDITDAAMGLKITTQPPAIIEASSTFSVQAKVVKADGTSTVTAGTDSVLFAELQVAWEKDVIEFYSTDAKSCLLYLEAIRLRGPNVEPKEATHNYVERVQMVNGVADFTGLHILDVTEGVRLNITVFSPTFPFSRHPNIYNDVADITSKIVDDVAKKFSMNLTWFDNNPDIDPAVVLTTSIEVTAQSADSLSIMNVGDILATQAANFPIERKLEIEILDSNGKRVYSGPDSTMTITSTAVAAGGESVCISSDAAINTEGGIGTFNGSICDPVTNTKLVFGATNDAGSVLATVETIEMDFIDEIHLANFIAYKYSGTDNQIGSHLDAMAHLAKQDVNSGYSNLLPDRTLELHSYDTSHSVAATIRQYQAMLDYGEANPHLKVRAVIGFGSNTVAEKMQPFLTNAKIPQLATREDKFDFGDKLQFPYYNRISWDMGAMSQSVMLAVKSRHWTKTVLLRGLGIKIDTIFYTKAKEFGIEIIEIMIPTLTAEQKAVDGALSQEFNKLKAANTKIVWLFLPYSMVEKVIQEAIIAETAPMHGYQWLTVGLMSWYLPYSNAFPSCKNDPICTVALTGTNGFASTYNLHGLRSPLWEHVLSGHIKKDPMKLKGNIAKHTLIVTTAEFVLGYDALLVYAHALHDLVENTKTITGASLALAVRDVSFEGLTGTIQLNENGNRPGYYGFSCIMNPHPATLQAQAASTAIIARYFVLETDDSSHQLELPAVTQWPLNVPLNPGLAGSGYNDDPVNPYVLPNTTFLNKRRYNSTNGMVDGNQELVPIPPSTASVSSWVEVEEDAVAPFYCTKGCGGDKLDLFDITKYPNGECVDMEVCSCDDVTGWFGETCEEMICICKNGHCDVPKVCVCDAGWTGAVCETAICKEPCQNGKCTGPDMCTCDGGYVGGTCGTNLGVVIAVTVIAVVTIAVAAFFFARWFMKRHALAAALKNLDWRVIWEEEVQTGVGAVSMVSTAQEEFSSKKNFVNWKAQRCYSQKYDSDHLNINDEALRLEIVHLKELRHNNLIQFVGACLEWPNVCILSEACPKGSIEDVLANDTVSLGWDFKYSLLKDICRGMDYLHRSALESHGRLNSRNCLVDNRWTCKLAGFGVPTIRYRGPRKKLEGTEIEVTDPVRALFWTPPELLVNCKHINDIGKGTPSGDVYAFAIIMTEVMSREEPYTNEMSAMSSEEILLLVKDKSAAEAARAKRRWYETGGDTTKHFRPKVDDADLPDDYAAKNGLRKLIEQDWHETPAQRLSFRQNLDKLNEIHPIKGELIDNLVNMLEKYSSNLENIVADRTKELMVEKAKTEQLVSQMLPKKVVEDLKHGRTVEPETFECVTIFFSDLVGFTAIAKDSTPLQVVDLLNDLYTTFDSILDNYDVYKVETIGDAYMVVSGLPVRNGDLHAGEIASVSLDLLSSMCDFKIRHLPGTVLQLRIGMHSGPAVAGVVGLKMPRYCLFGDTVNTASRMESSSIALRIHMSESTANILFKLGGYHLDCRGEREVKGKGTMITYWLEGKDGFTKKLPGADMAVSLSKHEFK